MKPEKKLRTAETEICLSVMSNSGFGDWNLVKIRAKSKTEEVVWDDLRTAMKPEKKLQTAEIEIYRLVMSNGVFGDGNVVNENLGFRFWDQKFSGV